MGAIVILLMGVLLASSAAAATVPATLGNGGSWAYGGSRTVNFSGTIVTMMGTDAQYSGSSHAAVSVIFNQTNTTNTTFMVEGQRTVGVTYSVTFCRPSCGSAAETLRVNASAWDREVAFANFTRVGSVLVNGQSVPAIALENVSSSARSNLTVVGDWSGKYTGSMYASAAGSSQAQVTLTPALGLFPVSPSPGEIWNASSSYLGSGSWSLHYYYESSSAGLRSGNASGTLARNGTVYLSGQDLGNTTLPDGSVANGVRYHLAAPFRLSDGIFMAPLDGNLFAGHMQMPWAPGLGPLGASFGDDTLYLGHGMGHFGLMAASVGYAPQANMMNDTMMSGTGGMPAPGGGMGGGGMGGGMGGMVPSVTTSTSNNLTASSVSANPMPVTAAENLGSSILSYSASLPTLAKTGPTGHLFLLAMVVGAVAVVGVVAVLYTTKGRRRGSLSATNDSPYRQAVVGHRASSGPKTPSAPKEEDPLSHLM